MLETCWSPGVLYLWRIGKSFSQLLRVGVGVRDSEEKFKAMKEIVALLEVLISWYKIEQFLKTSEVKKDRVQAFLS